jgi:carboxyl-terminal processing protease
MARAARAGMLTGERIVGINGQSIREMSTDEAADLLKGEQGSYVEVTLLTATGQTRRMQVRRDRVEVPSVEQVQMLDAQDGVGYFRISSFQKTTSRDVDAALWKLHREGMRSLVVDVRGNPGGLLNEAVEVADRFVAEGTIVATHGRSARENYDYKAHRVGTWRVPLVVLIDGDSASASEIFAGAIRDHRRGTVVGDRSYGKGSVQGIFPLRAMRGGVRLTTAKFFSPSGRAISKGGVEPDVAVRTTLKPNLMSGRQLDLQQDEVLAAGTKIARDLVASRVQSLEAASRRAAQADTRGNLERSTRGW